MSTQELPAKVPATHGSPVNTPGPNGQGTAHAPPPPPPPLPAPPTLKPADHGEHGEEEIPHDLHRPHFLLLAAVLLAFAAALAGLFFAGWGPYKNEHQQADADAAQVAAQIPTVSVMAPTREPVSHEIVLPCDIRPFQETLIYPRASGYLQKQYVDIDDRVTEGQVLAEIAATEVDAQLAQAKAAAQQSRADAVKAQADLDLAERTLERYQDVASSGVSKQERDEKVSARDQAKAALEQAQANVAAADADVQRLTVMQGFEKITAPFSGQITARNYDVGTLFTAGNMTAAPLFRLTQATTLRVFVNVPQVEASQIKVGQEAALEVRNFPGKTFTGTVARVSGAIDAATRTMPFELHFSNADNALFAGMYGQVRLTVTDGTPALVVPTSRLVFNAGGTQLAVIREGKVHFEKVSLGQDMGTSLEITGGIDAGEQIVVNPSERLVEGGDVNVNVIASKTADAAPAASAAATQAAQR